MNLTMVSKILTMVLCSTMVTVLESKANHCHNSSHCQILFYNGLTIIMVSSLVYQS